MAYTVLWQKKEDEKTMDHWDRFETMEAVSTLLAELREDPNVCEGDTWIFPPEADEYAMNYDMFMEIRDWENEEDDGTEDAPDSLELIPVEIRMSCMIDTDKATDLSDNFLESYPEFRNYIRYHSCKPCIYGTNLAWYLWIPENCFDEATKNSIIRLTRHAEGIYEGTGAEYVHVEVCINGEWYGRSQ